MENIPTDIETIEDYAFYSCKNLEETAMPNSIKTIGKYAFSESTNLVHLTLSNQVELIDQDAFKNCTSLTGLTFPNSLKTIEYEAFLNCSGLTELDIPSNVETIKRYSFENCTGLTRVEITTDTTHYGTAFYGCSNIDYVKIKVGTTTVMKNVETETDTFTSQRVIWSYEQHHIKGGPWYYAKQGVIVEIEDGITKIGTGTFCDAVKIGKIIIPPSVTEIGDKVFRGMTQMTSQTRSATDELNVITIPDTITTIGIDMCKGCSNLTSFELPKAMIDSKQINIGTYQGTKITQLDEIPSSIEVIGNYAFYNCQEINELIMPENTTSIGNYAFYSCKGFTQIIVPDNIVSIGNYAFYDCSNVTKITLNDGLQTLGEYAFSKCSGVDKIKIPNSVTQIKGYCFENCTALTDVEVPCDVQFATCAFRGCSNINDVKLIVGTTTIIKDSNTSSSGWSGNGLNNIYGTPWYYSSQDVKVEIEDGVTKIGSYILYGGTKIKNLIIPTSVTVIANSAFYNCSDSLVINYRGTSEQWAAITKGTNNDKLSTLTINYNYSGE